MRTSGGPGLVPFDPATWEPLPQLSFLLSHFIVPWEAAGCEADVFRDQLHWAPADNPDYSVQFCGSVFDGLSVPPHYPAPRDRALLHPDSIAAILCKPDIDLMIVYNAFRVYADKESAGEVADLSHIACIMDASESHPGYLRLKLYTTVDTNDMYYVVQEGDDKFVSGHRLIEERLHDFIAQLLSSREAFTRRRGPAVYHWEQNMEFDHVLSLPCSVWPPQASVWATRTRVSGWPPQQLREAIVDKGCHVVAAPHPCSRRPAVEWRLSFSEAEAALVAQLPPSARHSYRCFKALVGWVTRAVHAEQAEARVRRACRGDRGAERRWAVLRQQVCDGGLGEGLAARVEVLLLGLQQQERRLRQALDAARARQARSATDVLIALDVKMLSKKHEKCLGMVEDLTRSLQELIELRKRKLSSYCLKNVLLWAMERAPPTTWSDPETGLARGLLCLLQELLNALWRHRLPHYFVSDNNLLDHIPPTTMELTRQRLQSLRMQLGTHLIQYSRQFRFVFWPRQCDLESVLRPVLEDCALKRRHCRQRRHVWRVQRETLSRMLTAYVHDQNINCALEVAKELAEKIEQLDEEPQQTYLDIVNAAISTAGDVALLCSFGCYCHWLSHADAVGGEEAAHLVSRADTSLQQAAQRAPLQPGALLEVALFRGCCGGAGRDELIALLQQTVRAARHSLKYSTKPAITRLDARSAVTLDANLRAEIEALPNGAQFQVPTLVLALYCLLQAYRRHEDAENAATTLVELNEIAAEFDNTAGAAHVYALLGYAQFELGDALAAERAFCRALKARPGYGLADLNRRRCRRARGQAGGSCYKTKGRARVHCPPTVL